MEKTLKKTAEKPPAKVAPAKPANKEEIQILRERYKATGFETMSAFVRSVGSKLSQTKWGGVIVRGERAHVGTILTMCAELNCSRDEIVEILAARHEYSLIKIISVDPISIEERKLLQKFKKIEGDPAKVKLLYDMIDNFK